ncbi:MAG: diacylglycerol/polyprenol kinase family protein [Rhodothermales bacterium]
MQKTSKTSPEISYKAELIRKSLHLLAMVIPIGMLYLGKNTSLLILVPFCFLAIFLEIARVKSHKAAQLVEKVFGVMMRPAERPEIGEPVVINGATWVLLSATLLVFIFPVEIAAIAMITFMISDAAAALVGRRFGRFNWGKSAKTIEGSAAFFITAILCLTLFDVLQIHEVLLVGLVAMLFELSPVPLNDNLYVPIATAGLIYSLLRFIHHEPLALFFY